MIVTPVESFAGLFEFASDATVSMFMSMITVRIPASRTIASTNRPTGPYPAITASGRWQQIYNEWLSVLGPSYPNRNFFYAATAFGQTTNLAVVAFVELARLKASSGGDVNTAVHVFAPVSGRGGWTLPERLRLGDYGLGQDDRAEEAQVLRPALQRGGARRDGGALNSWTECQRAAEHLRSLWGSSSADGAGPPTVAARPGRRSTRAPTAGQGALFGSDE